MKRTPSPANSTVSPSVGVTRDMGRILSCKHICSSNIMEAAMPRKYDLGRRADAKADTRRRITEAAVDLHATVGPARTTISAIAERAGVQRLTVYRHFPEEAD